MDQSSGFFGLNTSNRSSGESNFASKCECLPTLMGDDRMCAIWWHQNKVVHLRIKSRTRRCLRPAVRCQAGALHKIGYDNPFTSFDLFDYISKGDIDAVLAMWQNRFHTLSIKSMQQTKKMQKRRRWSYSWVRTRSSLCVMTQRHYTWSPNSSVFNPFGKCEREIINKYMNKMK